MATQATPMIDKQVSTTVNATQLNEKWDKLIGVFDGYYNSVSPTSVRQTINTAIADWQDFFFGNMDAWSETDLAKWRSIYSKTAETLAAAIPAAAKAEALPVVAPAKNQPAKDGTTFYVTGQVEPAKIPDLVIPSFVTEFIDLHTPKWLIPTIVGIPAAYFLYKLARRRK